MDTLRKHFPQMTPSDGPWVRAELLRLAAAGFEQAGLWRDAAETMQDSRYRPVRRWPVLGTGEDLLRLEGDDGEESQ